eukprot:4474294-Amphidinium_carterae.2
MYREHHDLEEGSQQDSLSLEDCGSIESSIRAQASDHLLSLWVSAIGEVGAHASAFRTLIHVYTGPRWKCTKSTGDRSSNSACRSKICLAC